jgi:NhaP-type Na+/H+ or K+/H+ antiporter
MRGLGGALALALALSAPTDLPQREDTTAFTVVAFSVVVQGLTAPFALKASDITLKNGRLHAHSSPRERGRPAAEQLAWR